jgi:hypothetical protein
MSQKKSKKYSKKQKGGNAKWTPVLAAFGGVMLVFLAILALRSRPSPEAGQEITGTARLEVDKEEVDLGDVKVNQGVEVSFRLTNTGDRTLEFTDYPYIEVVEGC